jgi:hypothetical protein
MMAKAPLELLPGRLVDVVVDCPGGLGLDEAL